MKLQYIALAAAIASQFAVSAHASSEQHQKHKFNFAYQAQGEASLKPVHIFDNGVYTYFKMRFDGVSPEILLVTDEGSQPLRVMKTDQYHAVHAIGSKFLIRYGELEVEVQSTKNQAQLPQIGENAALPTPVSIDEVKSAATQKVEPVPKSSYGAVNPIVGGEETFSFSERTTPIPFAAKETKLSAKAEQAVVNTLAVPGRVVEVTVTGRENLDAPDGIAQLRAFAIRDRLIGAGVPAEKIVVKSGISDETSEKLAHSLVSVVWQQPTKKQAAQSAPPPAGPHFMSLASDQDIKETLQRWAKQANWTLVWNSTHFPKVKPSSFHGDFIEAASALFTSAQGRGIAFEVEAFSNNHLVVMDGKTKKQSKR